MNFDLRLWASCWSFRQTQYNISVDWRVASRNSTFPKPFHSVCSSFCSSLLQWRHRKGGSGQILKLLILQMAGLNLPKTGVLSKLVLKTSELGPCRAASSWNHSARALYTNALSPVDRAWKRVRPGRGMNPRGKQLRFRGEICCRLVAYFSLSWFILHFSLRRHVKASTLGGHFRERNQFASHSGEELW